MFENNGEMSLSQLGIKSLWSKETWVAENESIIHRISNIIYKIYYNPRLNYDVINRYAIITNSLASEQDLKLFGLNVEFIPIDKLLMVRLEDEGVFPMTQSKFIPGRVLSVEMSTTESSTIANSISLAINSKSFIQNQKKTLRISPENIKVGKGILYVTDICSSIQNEIG